MIVIGFYCGGTLLKTPPKVAYELIRCVTLGITHEDKVVAKTMRKQTSKPRTLQNLFYSLMV